MPLTRESILEAVEPAVSPAAAVQRITLVDGHALVRLDAAGVDRVEAVHAVGEAERAVRAAAARLGGPLASLRIEAVDRHGDVVAAAGDRQGPAEGDPSPPPGSPGAPADTAPPASSAPNPQAAAEAMPGVTHAIAVGAGKGGVGKSTVAVNLAVGLARRGQAVGVLDADIYGPSLPTLLGLGPLEQDVVDNQLIPFNVHGIRAATIGKLVEPDKPLIWRGPMAHGAFRQLLDRTRWGELDYLILDLPPGTGDVPLTVAQSLRLTGAVVVCTPQRVAQDDAGRAVRMFHDLGVPILGVVENMSSFIADDTDPPREYDLFGKGGAEQMAQRLGVGFLGAIPITMGLRQNSDAGDPSANFDARAPGNARLADALDKLVGRLESQVALASLRTGAARPSLTIS